MCRTPSHISSRLSRPAAARRAARSEASRTTARTPTTLPRTVEDPAEILSHGLVGGLHRMGVHPKGHGRVGVTEAVGDGTDVMATSDGHGRREVAQIMEPPVLVDARPFASPLPPPPDPVRVGRGVAQVEDVRPELLPLSAKLTPQPDRLPI